jgi:choline-sulfatase
MILAGPDVRAGHVCGTPVSLIDVHDTVLHSAGLQRPPPPSGVERRSLLDVSAAADKPERAVLTEYHAVGSPSAGFRLANARHAYHHYVGYRPELFDLVADPGETRDLAAEPRAPGVDRLLAQWHAQLAERLDPLAVDRAARRDQNALVASVGGREAALAIGPPGASPAPALPAPAGPGAAPASNGP